MQHNWWISAFELAGIWTREQAEHVSDSIKTAIHRERYGDAVQELKNILELKDFGVPSVNALEAKVGSLEAKVSLLTEQLAAKVEGKTIKEAPIATDKTN